MSIKSIKKRDGRVVAFDPQKISTAILKAFDAAYQPDMAETAERLSTKIASILEVEGTELPEVEGTELPEVEHVQDLVELVLMEEDYPETAKAYILYRSERARARALGERLKKIYEDITWPPAKNSDRKRENANINEDTAMGNLLKYGSESAKAYFLAYVLKPEFAAAHAAGDIHIHDLDFYTFTTTCTQIDLLKLFHGGFSGILGHLREPGDIATYSALACIVCNPTRMTSTADSPSPILTMLWRRAWVRPLRGATGKIWSGHWSLSWAIRKRMILSSLCPQIL